ncbi:MAG: hypothetical protein H8D22_06760 [Candidatus Cloacimonetes bacterium]|nr:hypothetical protein [Candidatus Cloacimonadota bacterium]
MKFENQNLDVLSMPFEARKELLDFYEFLIQKYKYRKKKETLPDEFYRPIQIKNYINYKREDIYNEI